MSIRKMSSIFLRAGVLLALTISSGACSWWTVGAAVGGAVVSRIPVGKEGESGPRVVTETGQGWRREVLDSQGRAFNASTYRAGQEILVRWHIPLRIGNPVDAVVAVAEPACQLSMKLPPSRWELRPLGRPATGEELWRVSGEQIMPLDRTRGRLSIGFQRADRLARETGLAPGGRPVWLIIAPRSGSYEMIVEWKGTEEQTVLSAQPCIRAWVETPLESAILLTEGRGAAVSSATPEQVTEGVVNTSDMGVSLPAASAASSGTVVRPPIEEGEQGNTVDLQTRYGLIGAPEYDIVRVHQAALAMEMQAPPANSRGEWDRAVAELRTLRGDLLRRLQQGSDGQRNLCILAERQGLSARPFKIWGGEATVPERVASNCP